MKPNPAHSALKKNVKARLMYTVDGTNYVTFDKSERVWPGFMPAYLLPATAEAYDAMVEQMAKRMTLSEKGGHACHHTWLPWTKTHQWYRNIQRKRARAALAAIGIKPALAPKKNGRGNNLP